MKHAYVNTIHAKMKMLNVLGGILHVVSTNSANRKRMFQYIHVHIYVILHYV